MKLRKHWKRRALAAEEELFEVKRAAGWQLATQRAQIRRLQDPDIAETLVQHLAYKVESTP